MTTKNTKQKTMKLVSLLFAGFVFAGATTLASCGDIVHPVDSSEIEESVPTEKTDARIKNGDFESVSDNNGKTLISTDVSSWTRSVDYKKSSAPSSSAVSGIIDVSENSKLFEENSLSYLKNYSETTFADDKVSEIAGVWKTEMNLADKLYFLQYWKKQKDADGKTNDVKKLSFYDENDISFNYNITYDDLVACSNPSVHDGAEDGDSHVLMIHNKTNARGTAQKFTSSSSVTVGAGTTAVVSVWVKTSDLQYASTLNKLQDVYADRGAYVSFTQTVGSTSLDPVYVNNIIADEWTEYTFYLHGSNYASSTFTMTLGLGQGGGNTFEYVEGYAFFDDAVCNVYSNEYFDGNVKTDVPEGHSFTADTLLPSVATDDKAHLYSLDLSASSDKTALDLGTVSFEETKESYNGTDYFAPVRTNATDVDLYTDFATLKTSVSEQVKKRLEKDNPSYPFGDSPVLAFISRTGAPMTAVSDKVFTLQSGENQLISFYLKTSDLSSATGVGVYLSEVGGEKQTLFENLSASTSTKTSVDDNETVKEKDLFDGWVRYDVVVSNEKSVAKEFTLSFTYGSTSPRTTTKSSYAEGYALLSEFETLSLSQSEHSYIPSGSTVKLVSFADEEISSKGFDTASTVPSGAIESGFALLQNYTGVYGGSDYVQFNETSDGVNNDVDSYQYAGLLNKAYVSSYPTLTGLDYADLFASSTQPLVIYNNEELAYGYFGQKKTISANSTETISVKVKASAGAKAYVYLIDKTTRTADTTLSLTTNGYGYWYDEDGNVCDKDPSASDFIGKNSHSSNVVLLLKDNGLYEINKKCSIYESSDAQKKAELASKVYANLKNYESDENGNLTVKQNGVSYAYDSSKATHQGNDGIAFYYKDGKYYAYSNYTTLVSDFTALGDIARYSDNAHTEDTVLIVDGDENSDWVVCSFAIHTGDEAKSYRLEVWSGSRDGVNKNPANTYVAFDTSSVSMAYTDSSFLADVKAYADVNEYDLDATKEALQQAGITPTYATFSFYDSPSFLRYDNSLDKDGVGNSYTDYSSLTYSEKVALARIERHVESTGEDVNVLFLDYSVNETNVPVSEKETDDDEKTDDTDSEGSKLGTILVLASSILLVVALLVAGVSILVRKSLKKKRHADVSKEQKRSLKKEKSHKNK